jgi:hypothetical protein
MQFYDGTDVPTTTSTTSRLSTVSKSTSITTSKEDTLRMPMAAATMPPTGVGENDNGNANNPNLIASSPAGLRSSTPTSVVRNSAPGDSFGSELDNNSKLSNSTKNTSLGIPMHPVPEVEIAELAKIIENAHRYLQIAFAEDLYLYCQANNINFAELRDSLNTKWNVNVLEPREGIGGHCLPKDTKMFLNSSNAIKSKIIEAAIEVDAEYRRYRDNRSGRFPHLD